MFEKDSSWIRLGPQYHYSGSERRCDRRRLSTSSRPICSLGQQVWRQGPFHVKALAEWDVTCRNRTRCNEVRYAVGKSAAGSSQKTSDVPHFPTNPRQKLMRAMAATFRALLAPSGTHGPRHRVTKENSSPLYIYGKFPQILQPTTLSWNAKRSLGVAVHLAIA